MFVLVIKVGIFVHIYYFKIIFYIFFKLGFLFYVCASIHLIYDLFLTTCIGIFHAYYEVFT